MDPLKLLRGPLVCCVYGGYYEVIGPRFLLGLGGKRKIVTKSARVDAALLFSLVRKTKKTLGQWLVRTIYISLVFFVMML